MPRATPRGARPPVAPTRGRPPAPLSMPIRRLAPALALAALALSATAAPAQDTPVGVRPFRFTVNGYLSTGRFDDNRVGTADRTLGGYGVRVMFNRSTPAATLRSFFGRSSVGAFATFTSGQGELDASTQHVGVQADFGLFNAPIFRGTLDPFVSLGAGYLRTAYDGAVSRVSNTDLAFTPAIGTRVPLFSGIGFRGDLRAPIVFGNRTTVNPVAEGGIYLSF